MYSRRNPRRPERHLGLHLRYLGCRSADKYLKSLEDCCQRIAAGNAHCRCFPTIDPGLGSHHCQHHYIFFLKTEPKPTIIADLHERMDVLERLKHRLD